MAPGDKEPTTRELKIGQPERQADEAKQHERRAEKAAYLKRKLEERERSEREG